VHVSERVVKVARKVYKCCLAEMIEEMADGCICVKLMFRPVLRRKLGAEHSGSSSSS